MFDQALRASRIQRHTATSFGRMLLAHMRRGAGRSVCNVQSSAGL
jgi:hypothetical protein